MVICEVTRLLPPIVLHSRVKSGVLQVRHSIVNSKYYTIRGRGVYGVICNIVRLLSASRAQLRIMIDSMAEMALYQNMSPKFLIITVLMATAKMYTGHVNDKPRQ